MLTRDRKSKMKNNVKNLNEYFDKRFIKLRNSFEANKNTLENFKNEVKPDFRKLEDKIDNEIKAL